MRAAEAFEHETRLPRKRNGALGSIGLYVLRCLLRLHGRKNGRLDPTHQWIADKTHKSRSAVVEAVSRLKACGVLDWIRRCVPIEDAQPDEQQSKQISNAFILLQPPTVRECARRMLRKPSEFVRASVDSANPPNGHIGPVRSKYKRNAFSVRSLMLHQAHKAPNPTGSASSDADERAGLRRPVHPREDVQIRLHLFLRTFARAVTVGRVTEAS